MPNSAGRFAFRLRRRGYGGVGKTANRQSSDSRFAALAPTLPPPLFPPLLPKKHPAGFDILPSKTRPGRANDATGAAR